MLDGLIEYCGPQRSGKSTLMCAHHILQDLCLPDKVIGNFYFDTRNYEAMPTAELLESILWVKAHRLKNIAFLFDEASQFMTGRGFKDQHQTEIASFLWQMPKRNLRLRVTSNPGASIDKIIRDAITYTIVPHYPKNIVPNKAWIDYTVVSNYEMWTDHRTLTNPYLVQQLFDTHQPID